MSGSWASWWQNLNWILTQGPERVLRLLQPFFSPLPETTPRRLSVGGRPSGAGLLSAAQPLPLLQLCRWDHFYSGGWRVPSPLKALELVSLTRIV